MSKYTVDIKKMGQERRDVAEALTKMLEPGKPVSRSLLLDNVRQVCGAEPSTFNGVVVDLARFGLIVRIESGAKSGKYPQRLMLTTLGRRWLKTVEAKNWFARRTRIRHGEPVL